MSRARSFLVTAVVFHVMLIKVVEVPSQSSNLSPLLSQLRYLFRLSVKHVCTQPQLHALTLFFPYSIVTFVYTSWYLGSLRVAKLLASHSSCRPIENNVQKKRKEDASRSLVLNFADFSIVTVA